MRVGDLGRVVTGRTPPAANPEYWGNDILFLTPTDMDGQRAVVSTKRSISSVGAKALSRIIVPHGIGVSCIGWQMGKAVHIGVPTITNQQINTIIHNRLEYDGLFIYYMMRNRLEEIFRLGSGGSRTPILNKSLFENIPLAVPLLKEQRAISAVLGAIDDKIELNRETSRTLEVMAEVIFRSWFVDFDPVVAKAADRTPFGMDAATAALFPDRFEDSPLGPIPAVWRCSSVGQEFNLTMGQSPPSSTYNQDGLSEPFFQGRTDFEFRFPMRRVFCTAATRRANAGDSLVSVRAPVGDVNIAAENCAVGRGLAAVRHKCGSTSYTYYAMRELKAEFEVFEGHGTLFGSIDRGSFHKIPMVAPASPVLAAFRRLVEPLDERIEASEQESVTLAELRDLLLPKLLSGELRVRDAEHVMAEAV
jgi:type I restriction enzyme, S subunit